MINYRLSLVSDLGRYIETIWGLCRPGAFLEVSARVNGTVATAERAQKARWRTLHAPIEALTDGDESKLDKIRDLSRADERIDVYFGCMPMSAPAEKGRGKGDLRESVPGIWFDIDCVAPGRLRSGKKTAEAPDGKPLFETSSDALATLDAFCAAHGVRAGVVTDSGFGVHAWILLDSPLGPDGIELVRRWNVAFADWCDKNWGIHVDVVSDKTRVLRVPEAVNWRGAKDLDDAVPVKLLRCESGARFPASSLGWTEALRAEIETARRARIERMERGGAGVAQEEALLDGRAALDKCGWEEILGRFGWSVCAAEGSNEIMRFARPRGSGGRDAESSSAVVFADAPWVLVVFSESAGLPAWDEIRRGEQMANTKWRTWVRLAYLRGGMTMADAEAVATADAVRIALHGTPMFWPATARQVLKEHGETFQAVLAGLDAESVGAVREYAVR